MRCLELGLCLSGSTVSCRWTCAAESLSVHKLIASCPADPIICRIALTVLPPTTTRIVDHVKDVIGYVCPTIAVQDDAPAVPAVVANPPVPTAEVPLAAAAAEENPSPQHTPANGHDTGIAADIKQEQQQQPEQHGAAAGGWVEAAPAAAAQQQAAPAGPLGNIKFKLKL